MGKYLVVTPSVTTLMKKLQNPEAGRADTMGYAF